MIGSNNKVFYPEFIVQDKEILLGTSKVQLLDLGSISCIMDQ